MKNFRERGDVRFRRTNFAHEFCKGAEMPYVLMAFFESRSKSFTENWIGRSDKASKECYPDLVKTAEAKMSVWATLQAREKSDAKAENDAAADDAPTWINAGEYIVGVGTPVEGVYPVMAFPRGSNRKLPVHQLLMRMGMAFVAQQLTEEMYERSYWMGNLVEKTTQVLSIQFLVVTSDGEIRYDSRQKQAQKSETARWMTKNGRISLPGGDEKSGLQEAIRNATSSQKRTSIVSIFTSPGVARLVAVTPLKVSNTTLALVMFESEQTDHYRLRERFFSAYRLTKSESMVAHEILSGRSIAEAAETKNLSPATVRSYMKQVLAKTGTHKQSELISLYFSSILPVASDLKIGSDMSSQ